MGRWLRGLACLCGPRVQRLGAALAGIAAIAGVTWGGEPPPSEAVRHAVEALVTPGRSDVAAAHSIRRLPRDDRAPLATRLSQSPQAAMRYHAMLILRDLEPRDAGPSARKLLADDHGPTRIEAALYPVEHARDLEARAVLDAAVVGPEAADAAIGVAALG